jgi:hypothetical protein
MFEIRSIFNDSVSNKVFQAHAGIMAQRMSPNFLKIRFSNTFFYAKSNKKLDGINKAIHLM